jgi:hypothetical protein
LIGGIFIGKNKTAASPAEYLHENTKKPGRKPVLVPGFLTKNSASGGLW